MKIDLREDAEAFVLDQSPNSVAGSFLSGSAFMARDATDDARRVFHQIDSVAPKNPRSPYLIGIVRLAQGNAADATRQFEFALTRDPSFLDALTQLVQIDLGTKRTPAALARVKKQIVLVGNSARHYALMGLVYLARSEGDLAESAFLKAIKWGEFLGAVTELKEAAAKLPDQPTVAYHLGMAYTRSGNIIDARRQLQRALEFKGDFPERASASLALSTLK